MRPGATIKHRAQCPFVLKNVPKSNRTYIFSSYTHARTFLPEALASVPLGFVLVRVRNQVQVRVQ
jgi:hypothetical protein